MHHVVGIGLPKKGPGSTCCKGPTPEHGPVQCTFVRLAHEIVEEARFSASLTKFPPTPTRFTFVVLGFATIPPSFARYRLRVVCRLRLRDRLSSSFVASIRDLLTESHKNHRQHRIGRFSFIEAKMANPTPDINSILKMLGGENRCVRSIRELILTIISNRCDSAPRDIDTGPRSSLDSRTHRDTSNPCDLSSCSGRISSPATLVSGATCVPISSTGCERQHRSECHPTSQLGHSPTC